MQTHMKSMYCLLKVVCLWALQKIISRLEIETAMAVFAIGTCSSFGGIQSAYPNPINGHALSEIFEREIINVPGCPPSDKNIVATLLYYYLFAESQP